jgi:potassium-dependent mechanosensitive channel
LRAPRSLRGAPACVLALLAAVVSFLPPVRAEAQPPSPSAAEAVATPAPTPAPEPIPLPEIAQRAEAVGRTLREIEAESAPLASIVEIGEQEKARLGDLEKGAAEALQSVEGGLSLPDLGYLERTWLNRASEAETWSEQLTARATALDRRLSQLDRMEKTWTLTLREARSAGAPAQLQKRVGEVLQAVEAARRKVDERRSAVLTLQSQLADIENTVTKVLERVRAEQAAVRGRLFEPEQYPLWTALGQAGSRSDVAERVRASMRAEVDAVREVFERRADQIVPRLVGQLVLFAAVLVGALALKQRSQRRRAEGRGLGPSETIFDHPVAIALLAVLLPIPQLYPFAPSLVFRSFGLALMIPPLVLLPGLLRRDLRFAPFILAGFYLVDQLRALIAAAPVLERLLFELEIAVALAGLLWLLRPARLRHLPARVPGAAWLALGLRVSLALLGISVLANPLGFVDLAKVLGGGILKSAYAALIFYAATVVANTTATALLRGRPLRSSGVVRAHGPALERGAHRLIRLGFGLWWASWVLTFFEVRGPVLEALRWLLDTPFTAGTIAVSLGDLLAFALTVALAFWSARAVRLLLEEDVLPRVRLGRGIPYAIASTAQYGLLLVGFVLALGAAGVDFSRVTLLAGAFGVGIGFGLQNVVNNFVSGLILLYERPIQVGDTVQVGELLGRVQRIGIRSSTVRTWQGAEVIVPNGNLISQEVVNWTLSDRQRRIELPVGVAYGTDPERVIALLVEAAKATPTLLKEPEPVALFQGFGDSSLDFELRAWTENADFPRVRSDLALAVSRGLREAGIEIPFPQRDLHLRSLPPSSS